MKQPGKTLTEELQEYLEKAGITLLLEDVIEEAPRRRNALPKKKVAPKVKDEGPEEPEKGGPLRGRS